MGRPDGLAKNEAQFFTGHHIAVVGGNFVGAVYNASESENVSIHRRLHNLIGGNQIDCRLLHNSKHHEPVLNLTEIHPEIIDVKLIRILHESTPISTSKIALYNHHCDSQLSAICHAVYAAKSLADKDALLANIILPPYSRLNHEKYLIPTIAYQLACNIPEAAEHVLKAFADTPHFFELNTETQIRTAIIDPLRISASTLSPCHDAKWVVFGGLPTQYHRIPALQKLMGALERESTSGKLGFKLAFLITSSDSFWGIVSDLRPKRRHKIIPVRRPLLAIIFPYASAFLGDITLYLRVTIGVALKASMSPGKTDTRNSLLSSIYLVGCCVVGDIQFPFTPTRYIDDNDESPGSGFPGSTSRMLHYHRAEPYKVSVLRASSKKACSDAFSAPHEGRMLC